MKGISLLVGALLVSGCGGGYTGRGSSPSEPGIEIVPGRRMDGSIAGQPSPLPAFSAEEVAYAAQPGTGVIDGQAFLRTRGGDVKYGAGSAVFLLPLSAYTSAWV